MSRINIKEAIYISSIDVFLAVLFVTAIFSCSDEDDEDDDDVSDDDDDDDDYEWGDWWPPTAGMTFVFQVAEWQGFSYDMTATIIGQEEYNEGTYTKLQLGDFTADDIVGLQGWFDFSTEGQVGFAGAEIYWTNTSKADLTPNGIFELDAPVYIYINPMLDHPKSSTASGTWTIWDNPGTYDVTLTSTTISTDASVTVPYGTVDDCFEIKVDFLQQFSLWDDVNGSATFYFHHELGLVMTSGSNLMGFSLKLKEIL